MNNWCKHEWIANSGRGEEPVYRLNSQMGAEPIMHARCKVCEDRTWFTEQQWVDLVVTPNDNHERREP